MKDVFFHIYNGPTADALTVSLCWSFHLLADSFALSPGTLQPHSACYIDQLVERRLSLPLLTSPYFSLLLSLFSSSPLSVTAAERLYSQLERNRLLSNELKLTLHDLCD